MRCIGLWALGVGVLVGIGPLGAERGYADDAKKCAPATLKGRYLFGGSATVFPPAFGVTEPSPASAAGYHIYNGDGTGTDFVTFFLNGAVVPVPSPAPVTYTLNSDCTGTSSVQGGPNFDIFVSPDGNQLVIINTDPGTGGVLASTRAGSK